MMQLKAYRINLFLNNFFLLKETLLSPYEQGHKYWVHILIIVKRMKNIELLCDQALVLIYLFYGDRVHKCSKGVLTPAHCSTNKRSHGEGGGKDKRSK